MGRRRRDGVRLVQLSHTPGPPPHDLVPSFKKLLSSSSVDEAAIGELFFELDGNLCSYQ